MKIRIKIYWINSKTFKLQFNHQKTPMFGRNWNFKSSFFMIFASKNLISAHVNKTNFFKINKMKIFLRRRREQKSWKNSEKYFKSSHFGKSIWQKPTFLRETGFYKDQSDISDYTKLIRNRSKTFADATNKGVKNGGDQITKTNQA